jgi:alkaline phosphatase
MAAHVVMLYDLGDSPAAYPMIVSANDGSGKPIGWGALSGLASDPKDAGKLYAVSDSVYRSQPSIFTINATRTPAEIVNKIVVTRDGQPAQKLELEGIVSDGKDGFWLASEGDAAKLTSNAVYKVDAKGEIKQKIALPAELLGKDSRFGYEGITVVGEGDDQTLVMAVQLEWADDAKGEFKLLA